MNADTISLESHKIIQNLSNNIINKPNNPDINIKRASTKLNSKLTKISKKIRPESAVFTLIKLLVENHDQIQIDNSVLTIDSEDQGLIEKLNYCMEFLAQIPFSFKYNEAQTKIFLDFFHLEKEMNLINKLEIKNDY